MGNNEPLSVPQDWEIYRDVALNVLNGTSGAIKEHITELIAYRRKTDVKRACLKTKLEEYEKHIL